MRSCTFKALKNPKAAKRKEERKKKKKGGTRRQAWRLQIAWRGCVERLNLPWDKCKEQEEEGCDHSDH